jgi:hypothetical protein
MLGSPTPDTFEIGVGCGRVTNNPMTLTHSASRTSVASAS